MIALLITVYLVGILAFALVAYPWCVEQAMVAPHTAALNVGLFWPIAAPMAILALIGIGLGRFVRFCRPQTAALADEKGL